MMDINSLMLTQYYFEFQHILHIHVSKHSKKKISTKQLRIDKRKSKK